MGLSLNCWCQFAACYSAKTEVGDEGCCAHVWCQLSLHMYHKRFNNPDVIFVL